MVYFDAADTANDPATVNRLCLRQRFGSPIEGPSRIRLTGAFLLFPTSTLIIVLPHDTVEMLRTEPVRTSEYLYLCPHQLRSHSVCSHLNYTHLTYTNPPQTPHSLDTSVSALFCSVVLYLFQRPEVPPTALSPRH